MSRLVSAATSRELRVRLRRKRNPETLHLRMDVPAEIAEINSDAMVTAATARGPDGQESEYKAYAGRFFVPVHEYENGKPVKGKAVDAFFAGTLPMCRIHPDFSELQKPGEKYMMHARALPTGTEGHDIVEIVSDNSEDRATEVRRKMAGFVLVDGALWRSMPEPVWVVRKEPKGRLPLVLEASFDAPAEGNMVFRLDRADDADRYVRGLSKALRRAYSGGRPSAAVGSGILQRDDRLHSVVAMGARVVSLCPKGWLQLLPRDAISAWLHLREDIKTTKAGHVAPDTAEQIAARTGLVLAAIDGLVLNSHGEADRTEAKKELYDVLKRWSDFEGGTLDVPALDDEEAEALAGLSAV